MQPVGAPVRRLISAVAPDRTDLHAARALPGRLPVENIVAGHQDLAGRGRHLLRDRRRLAVALDPRESQDAEGDAENDDRSEEHTSELQSLMRISYAVFSLK